MIENKTPYTEPMPPAYEHYNTDPERVKYTIKVPEPGNWSCYLFGGSPQHQSFAIIWRPEKGQEPNWFWRKMQYLCFGNVWIKDK